MNIINNQWYVVLESRELRHKLLAVERLGQQMIFWRSREGEPHAHLDRCPHLGASLRGGHISGERFVCPFHGFAFDADGHCRHIPSVGKNGKIPAGMKVKSFPLREQFGLLWLWWGEHQDVYPEVPFFAELETGWNYGSIVTEWPVHYTRAIENQLDVAHLPFVHRTTIGAGVRTYVEGPYVEADQFCIKVWVTNRFDDGSDSRSLATLAEEAARKDAGITFLFPCIWLLKISEKFKLLVAFTPINDTNTRFYVRSYHRIGNLLLAKAFELAVGISNRYILWQDRCVVVTQKPSKSTDAKEDRLIGADRAISQFRRLHAELMKADCNGHDPGLEDNRLSGS